ncbi:MAG: TldD/PmbA family protein [Cyanobacteria bacterium J06621_8]
MNREQLRSAIARYRNQVDYLDIRVEQSESTELSYRGQQLDTVDRSFALDGGVRACHRGGWSFVTFNGLNDLDQRIATAISQAKLVGDSQTKLAPVATIEDIVSANIKRDPRGVSLQEKRQLLAAYNEMLLNYDPRIQTTKVSISDRFAKKIFANSTGSLIVQERLDINGRFAAIAKDSGIVRRGAESLHSRNDFNALVGIEERVQGATARAIRQLEAKSIKGEQYTVVLDPYLAGVFIHEAFGHLSEADYIYENPQMQKLLTLGKPIAIPQLNVVDDATLENFPGSMKYDDEGVPGQRKYLIKNGILNQRLHSRETAGKMAETPTGNARAINASYPPLVRMTNTAIKPGSTPRSEIFAGIKEGVYALGVLGGQTNGEMFTFTAAEGYMIREGKVAEPISNITLSGNVFQTLQDIEAISNDLLYTNGGCGKGEQSSLPVSVGAPHIRIRNVIVGGK